eukprot:gnl/TRDRNA2_/TRDRNA2_167468_c0_seq10.p1 gnl/TRDRNA2_/TRDRNA2_167468_c0~~gnl/TRDRNA2_/TRDRNA2_167468_c0_seq10.p1  ORF type:complete len:264 (-),score=27.35 gnl/TRDRNA2_/TRDRNA2_167468_c0_seq10:189-980(-)
MATVTPSWLLSEITSTISMGAPMFNESDAGKRACYRLYLGLTIEVTGMMKGLSSSSMSRSDQDLLMYSRDKLESAKASAMGTRDYSKGAWTMREAFDKIVDKMQKSGTMMQMPGPGGKAVMDIEEKKGVPSFCQASSASQCGYPNCGCESKAKKVPSFCQARSASQCGYPNCGCQAKARGCGGVPAFCQARSASQCAYPNCGCSAQARGCGGAPSFCQSRGCCKYPSCDCEAKARGGCCGGRGSVRCQNPCRCQYPRCNCPRC